MNEKETIARFYEAFAKSDAGTMAACYADDVIFSDPAFGTLRGEDARNMWRMLVDIGKGSLHVVYDQVEGSAGRGSARWIAEYVFQATGRPVRNIVHASFEFRDGKVIRHTDRFDFPKWARQAFGFPGLFLGWSPFLRKILRKRSRALLDAYGAEKHVRA